MTNAKTKALAKKASGKKFLHSRIKSLRNELNHERISYGELAELGRYKKHLIRSGDVHLAEAAGIPEHEFMRHQRKHK